MMNVVNLDRVQEYSKPMFLTEGNASPGETSINFKGNATPLSDLQHGKHFTENLFGPIHFFNVRGSLTKDSCLRDEW